MSVFLSRQRGPLYWGCDQITDAGLAHLVGMPLTSLDLGGCHRITDAGLAYLPKTLTSLNLSSCDQQITDAGLVHLAGLVNLTSLDLRLCRQITDAGLAHLAGLVNLTSLNLGYCRQITDAGLTAIRLARPGLEIIH